MLVHRLLFVFGLFFTALFSCAATSESEPDYGGRQSVGLVLSGGGAKGIAHIGVIKALEEHNIPIDYIAGTSMGAIIGGLYACGYTPEEMMQLVLSDDFKNWSSGKIDRKLTYYFAQGDPTPELGSISIGAKDSTEVQSVMPLSLISPLPMNFAFMDLFSAYTAQCGGNFDNLFVPFRCVTSDVYHKHKIVLSHGSVGDAIRASMSFPMVFHPIEMDGVLVYDGGIYDNFPVDVMRSDFAPSIMIGVNVSGPDKKPNPNNLFQQLEDMIIQNNDYSLPAEEGIKMDVPVRMFGLLDWDAAPRIYEIGYNTAMEMMDSICGRVTSRVPQNARRLRRQVFKATTPYVRFDSVSVTGASRHQNEYIKYLFTHNSADTFGISSARDAYYRALTPGRLRNLMPHALYNDTTGLFTLDLDATVKRNFKLGFGGYITSSTSSMLFISGGYNTLSFNSAGLTLNGWVGQSYLAAAINAKMNLRTSVPSRFHLQLVGLRHRYFENDKLFFEDNQPVFITREQLFSIFNYEWAAGQRGRFTLGVGWGHLKDRFYHNNTAKFTSLDRDVAVQNLGKVQARYSYNTLNDYSLPTAGAAYDVAVIGVAGNYNYHPGDSLFVSSHRRRHWLQAELRTQNYFDLSRHFTLGVTSDILWSNRGLLGNYYSTIVEAPAFHPTPSSYNSFNSALRANSFVALGVVPVWKMSQMVQVRGDFHLFLPERKIRELTDRNYAAAYGHRFDSPQFFGEVAGALNLQFATIKTYVNYTSYPANNWGCGISIGVFILAPDFLR